MPLTINNIDLTYYALNLEKIDFNRNMELYNMSNVPNALFFNNFAGTTDECEVLNKYIKKIFIPLTKILYNAYDLSKMKTDIKSFNNAYDLNVISSKECLNNTLTRLINQFVYSVIYNTMEYFKDQKAKYKPINNFSDSDIINYSCSFFFILAPFIWPINIGKLPDEENIKIITKKYVLYCLYEYIEFINTNGFNIFDNNLVEEFSINLFRMSYYFMCSIILKLKDKNLIENIETDSAYLNYIAEII